MEFKKEDIIDLIKKIRRDIGHKDVDIDISTIIFDEDSSTLLIITPDRPLKSVVIGKGGWVVGRLREEMEVNSIHVEAYSDYIVPLYQMKLALDKLEKIIPEYESPLSEPLINLAELLAMRIENPYDIEPLLKNFNENLPGSVLQDDPSNIESNVSLSEQQRISSNVQSGVSLSEQQGISSDIEGDNSSNNQTFENNNFKAVVALSGGVDSSSSLLIAQLLGFKPIAVTVNPGDIILPKYFRQSVENLTQKLGIEHRYLEVEMDEVVKGALAGTFHPCGRCSKVIEEALFQFTKKNNIPFLIYGDLLSTGDQAFQKEENILRINLPALLALKKGDVKKIAGKIGVEKKGGYGCPLIGEVHRKHPHMRQFSIQRVLRETRAGALEPGEALNQIKGIL